MLERDEIVIIDGGTGSELVRRGLSLSREAWSGPAAATHGELLCDIHLDYIRAGADVITTNTFGTSRFVLAGAGLEDEFERINALALDAALEARAQSGRAVRIAGSISCLPPRFDVRAYPDRDTELACYVELAEYLALNGADLLVLEMMQETEHAMLACEAARRTGLEVWLGLSSRIDASGRWVAYDFADVAMSEVLTALLPFAPAAVNLMHSPPSAVVPALAALKAVWSGPCGVYPEIATENHAPTPGIERVGMGDWTALARGWLDAGARILGGCCGTTPAHIRALRALADERRGQTPRGV